MGGGPWVDALMRRLGKTPRFVDGLRVTDGETMELVEMVLGRWRYRVVTNPGDRDPSTSTAELADRPHQRRL